MKFKMKRRHITEAKTIINYALSSQQRRYIEKYIRRTTQFRVLMKVKWFVCCCNTWRKLFTGWKTLLTKMLQA